LDTVLAHECAHVRRRDFAKNLLYGIVSLPIAYHPLLSLTRARLAETREMVCDTMAAEAVGGREGYARSLLRLASMLADHAAPKLLHAIGILDANIFERRVMNLTRKSLEVRGAVRLAVAVACGLVAFATCASAMALRMDVTEPSTQDPAPAKVKVKVGDLTILNKVPPVYPAEAKANKDTIDGAVLLMVTVGKDGVVGKIKVEKSLRPDYDKSALDAVRQWRYKPYLLNGNPIEVDTTITIVYSMGQ
jgi:TonB family protein